MKELYTIGETALLLGVTTQTLRHYDKIGLLSPSYTDKKNGYRYYSFNQFHYIDRIKYLQGFGLSLEEIREIILDGSVDRLLPFLKKQKEICEEELKATKRKIKDIEWYIDYFTYFNKSTDDVYKAKMDTRYIINVPCYNNDKLSDMEIRLASKKSKLSDLNYRRQYGYILNFDDVLNKKFNPQNYFVFLRGKSSKDLDGYIEIPAGEYLCYRSKILTNEWEQNVIKDYLQYREKNPLVLALEYEGNLKEYDDAWYEIQILL